MLSFDCSFPIILTCSVFSVLVTMGVFYRASGDGRQGSAEASAWPATGVVTEKVLTASWHPSQSVVCPALNGIQCYPRHILPRK